jgi:hypothetical protein
MVSTDEKIRGRHYFVLLPFYTGYGGESWSKTFFSVYRPSCRIEAYIRPEKYYFVWAGPLANHPFNFNLIFLSDGLMAAAERAACFPALNRR